MARVTCYAIILLFLLPVPFSFSMDVNDALKYILLIKDVHKYYKTTCIIIVHSDSDTVEKSIGGKQLSFQSWIKRLWLTYGPELFLNKAS